MNQISIPSLRKPSRARVDNTALINAERRKQRQPPPAFENGLWFPVAGLTVGRMKMHKACMVHSGAFFTLIFCIVCQLGCSKQGQLESALDEISRGYDRSSEISRIINKSTTQEERRVLTAFAVTALINDLGASNPEVREKASNALGMIAYNFDGQMINNTFDALIEKCRYADSNTQVTILLAATTICVYADKNEDKTMGKLAHKRYNNWLAGK